MPDISKSGGSTLASWLRGLDAARLEQVLVVRTDAVCAPEPRSVGELADRLQRPGAVALVLPRLTLPHLQVAEVLAALGPVPRDALAELLGAVDGERGRGLEAALEVLADHALVWPDDRGLLHMVAPLRRAWDTPLGLDAPLTELLGHATSDELRRMLGALGIKAGGTKQQRLAALVDHHSDPGRVAEVVAQAPAATRKLLERRARTAPERPEFVVLGGLGDDSEPGARWALERGLLVQDRHRYGPARMPAEVALALRGADWHALFEPAPPVTASVSVTSADVEREAAAAAMSFATHAASVLAVSATSPLVRLKAGGIGARELARVGKAAQCDDVVVRIVLETAYAAGLLARDGDKVAATEGYDTWAEREPAEQVAVLLQAWRKLPLAPAQARDQEGKALPALSGTPPCAGCLHAREGLLIAAARLPAGRGVKSGAELGPSTAWYRPLAEQLPQDATPFATVIREAELLGVLARGALSPIGAALLDLTLDHDAEALAAACQRLLPAATTVARFGADLTAVVTGTPSACLATLLDSVADRETGGTASVWRFSPATIRRALDAGRSPDLIVGDLAAVAVEPLPQPLSYLVHDAARSHGRVRVAAAACVIHSEGPALLDELAAHRKLAELGLRRLAPTVLVSRTPLERTLAALRTAGYAPVAERADGTVRVERATHRRAAAPVPPPRLPDRPKTAARTAEAPTTVDLSALAARLRAAPPSTPQPDPYNGAPFDSDTEEIIAGYARQLSLTDVRQLAHAVNEGQAVTIEYVAASGNRTIRTVSGLELDAPYLYAWCHLRNDERVFTISRIHGVMPA